MFLDLTPSSEDNLRAMLQGGVTHLYTVGRSATAIKLKVNSLATAVATKFHC